MFNLFSKNPTISLFKADHERVQGLFDEFEKAKSRAAKKKFIRQALTELKVHDAIEEEIFYPPCENQSTKRS